MTTQISIEQLAQKLNKQLWVKADLKRIYMNDAGYNTKKMSTKTFIWQDENGEFKVSCKIDCPSQPYQWIESQEEEVRQSILDKIDEALATEVFVIKVEKTGKYDCYNGTLNYASVYYSEEKANRAAEEAFSNCTVEKWNRSEFETEVEKLDEAERIEREAKKQAEQLVVNTIPAEKPAIKNTTTPTFGVDTRVNNPRFGNGTVIAESDDTIEVNFDIEGNKRLLKKFAKLERI